MNNKFFILAVIGISIALIAVFLFKNPTDISYQSNWTKLSTVANFSYSWTVESLSWDLLVIRTSDWKLDNLLISSGIVIMWIDSSKPSIADIKKWFGIKVEWSIKDIIKTIEKLVITKEENIIIYSPVNNIELISPIILRWEARVYENTINYIVTDSSWRVLSQWIGTTDSTEPSKFWTFSVKVNFRKPKTKTGIIEVFEVSEKDGSIVNSTKVDVLFWKTSTWISL